MLQFQSLTPSWEIVSDQVMGGLSKGTLRQETVCGRVATRLTGRVSLKNNGGFLQMAFDLAPSGPRSDASRWTGIALDVLGNDRAYDVRMRTHVLTRPWQSFRAEIIVSPTWQTMGIPFDTLMPHRTDLMFDASELRRIGVLAVGCEMDVDIAVGGVRFYA